MVEHEGGKIVPPVADEVAAEFRRAITEQVLREAGLEALVDAAVKGARVPSHDEIAAEVARHFVGEPAASWRVPLELLGRRITTGKATTSLLPLTVTETEEGAAVVRHSRDPRDRQMGSGQYVTSDRRLFEEIGRQKRADESVPLLTIIKAMADRITPSHTSEDNKARRVERRYKKEFDTKSGLFLDPAHDPKNH